MNIDIRPLTTNGRFIGPAQGDAFSVDGAGIELTNINDKQDGSYTLVLTGDPNAQISAKVLGEEIYQGPASEMGKTDWPIWLVIFLFLILLLLIWLVWYLIGGTSRP